MALARNRRRRNGIDIWPGFVDALAQLLMVIIFILLVFTVGQFYLNGALSSKQVALDQLTRQLNDLNQLFNQEKSTSSDLRNNADSLSRQLQAVTADRDALTGRLSAANEQLRSAEDRADKTATALGDANRTIAADREQIQLRLSQLESLRRDIDTLTKTRTTLEAQVATLAAAGTQSAKDLTALRDRSKDLEAQLSSQAERTALAQKEVDNRDVRLRARDEQIAELNQNIQTLRDQLSTLSGSLQTAQQRNSDQQNQLSVANTQSGGLKDTIASLRTQLSGLDAALKLSLDKTLAQASELANATEQVNRLKADSDAKSAELNQLKTDAAAMRSQLAQLGNDLKASQDKTAEQAKQLAALEAKSAEVQTNADATALELDAAKRNVAGLGEQVAQLTGALKASTDRVDEQTEQLKDLTAALKVAADNDAAQKDIIRELNTTRALAGKVEELAKFRSEFFGRLRDVLGDRPDIRIVGDRFVFQSEVLFEPGSADLGERARQSLDPVVQGLRDLLPKIPGDLNWVLRIDGHTDQRPISSPQFPSNWELSSARAISVVKYLVAQGIPADRLVAAGFGEFQPLDPGNSEAAMRRNRRIEIKLTER